MIINFRARRAVGGYRIVTVDERRLARATLNDDETVIPPPDATPLECEVLERWGFEFTIRKPEGKFRALIPTTDKAEEIEMFGTSNAIFLDFASLSSEQDITAFADKYGSFSGMGLDYLRHWRWETGAMKKAVEAWETAKRTADFQKVIAIVDMLARGKMDIDKGIGSSILLQRDEESALPRLSIRPCTFLDALWTQFLLAVDGNKNFSRCDQCPVWFPVGAAGHRPDRLYCSDACRMRAYRNRKSDI